MAIRKGPFWTCVSIVVYTLAAAIFAFGVYAIWASIVQPFLAPASPAVLGSEEWGVQDEERVVLDEERVVRDEEFNFEIAIPDSIDWMKFPLSQDKSLAHIRARFQTEYADTDPPATCDVTLMVSKLTKDWARQSLDRLALQWQPQMEGNLSSTREIKEGKRKLGGQECYYRDLKGEYIAGVAHVTWYLGKMGNYLYTFHAFRTYKAVGDEQIEEEAKEILDSFKYLKVIEVKEEDRIDPEEDNRLDPEKVKRETVTLSHWRLEAVKPKEMFNIDPQQFSKSEKANNAIAKFERRKQQSFIQIRIYAQSASSQKYTLDQFVRSTLKHWENTYKTRLKKEIDEEYKFPMAQRAIKMRIEGRRTVPETYTWIFAQCNNDRQYRISIYTTGATGEELWKAQIEDFLRNLKPLKR